MIAFESNLFYQTYIRVDGQYFEGQKKTLG